MLFIDARKMGHLVDRTRREFSDDDIATIATTYHAWRGEKGQGVPGYPWLLQVGDHGKSGHIITFSRRAVMSARPRLGGRCAV